MLKTMPRRGRPPGRTLPFDIRVRISEELRIALVGLKELQRISMSEIVRQALEAKLARDFQSSLRPDSESGLG